jgi:nitronate monooxygenase
VSGDPRLAARLASRLRLPVMAGPMFIASTPALTVAQCRSGIIGSMPALNPRTTAALDADIAAIERELAGCEVPYAINLVAHRTNARLDADLEVIVAHRVPIVVLALAANPKIVESVHAYGGLVFNDVAGDRHARKCAESGVDGIIAVAAGAGGHTGSLSPFALVQEIREWWDGPLLLAGCIATGRAILAAETLGADFAYIGSPFLASTEANTPAAFKQMVVDGAAKDIIVTKGFTGARASFLAPSLLANGLDPEALAKKESAGVDISDGGSNSKAWRDIWSAGQGIGAVKASLPATEYIDALAADYERAKQTMRTKLAYRSS